MQGIAECSPGGLSSVAMFGKISCIAFAARTLRIVSRVLIMLTADGLSKLYLRRRHNSRSELFVPIPPEPVNSAISDRTRVSPSRNADRTMCRAASVSTSKPHPTQNSAAVARVSRMSMVHLPSRSSKSVLSKVMPVHILFHCACPGLECPGRLHASELHWGLRHLPLLECSNQSLAASFAAWALRTLAL